MYVHAGLQHRGYAVYQTRASQIRYIALQTTHLNIVQIYGKNAQNKAIYILSLNSISLDIVKLSCAERLSNLLPVYLKLCQHLYI